MTNLAQLIQNALDSAPTQTVPSIKSYWMTRADIGSDSNPDEYVVYTVSGPAEEAGADGTTLIWEQEAVIRYFVRDSKIPAGYSAIKASMDGIRSKLATAGLEISGGWEAVGDVDGIGYQTFVLNAMLTEADRG